MPTKNIVPVATSPINLQSFTSDVDDIGGTVMSCIAGPNALNYGDLVFWNLGGGVDKHLNASWYHSRFAGVVVGGTATNQYYASDPTLIGKQVSAAGEKVMIQRNGIAYVAADNAAGFKYYGQPILPGQTTAGRALGLLSGNTGSYATTDSGFQISAGGSALGKTSQVTQAIISGALSTITAANTAALAGTVNNALFGIYEARSTGAANETTAHGTDAASLINVVLPAAPAVGVATYGVILVHPTGTGNFVGGTTALDDATVVPNAVFVQLYAYYYVMGWAIDTGITAGTALRMLLVA